MSALIIVNLDFVTLKTFVFGLYIHDDISDGSAIISWTN